MKRPLQLSLAIALALGVTDVLALGLGPVRVHSRLNQPLNAEIPVIQSSPGEAEGLLVTLAGAEEFERIGLSRSRLGVPLKFTLDKDASGAPVIKVTSEEPVRQSFLDFLVEANWPKGRLLREYTVLLDPPVTAPARTVASTPAAPPARRPAAPAAATAPMREAPTPVATPRAATTATAPAAAAGDYGPVESGQTLSQIARSVHPDEDLNRTMLALFKANPSAFYKDNINALKRGAILRVPDAEAVRAVGTAAAAAAQVHAQVEDWRGVQAAPTRVADASSPASAAGTPSSAGGDSERLELVPPKAGKDSLAMADRPGGSGNGNAATGALKAELARTREALGSEQQESKELKSRVQELEDLNSKNDRLISLKDSEIADLQRKLKELRTAAEGTSATAPVAEAAPAAAPVAAVVAAGSEAAAAAPAGEASAPAATTAAEPIGKDDIWGTGGPEATATDGAGDPAATAGKTGVAPLVAAGTPADATAATGETAPAEAAAPSDATTDSPGNAASAAVAPAAGEDMVDAPAAGSTPDSAASAQTSVEPAATPASPGAARVEPAPVGAAPVPVQTETSMGPWYLQAWVKPAALIAGILVLLAAWFGMRRRKQVPAGRSSIADAFGDSPLPAGAAGAGLDQEEAELLARLEDHPQDAGLHLELLSIYYARRDVEAFEIAASQMHDIVGEEHQAEWLEAQAMGQELAPHNPLFAVAGDAVVGDQDAGVDLDSYARADVDDDATLPEPPPAHVLANFDDEQPAALAREAVEERVEHASDTADHAGSFGIDHDFATEAPAAAAEFDHANPFGDLPPIDFDAGSPAMPAVPEEVQEASDALSEFKSEPVPVSEAEAEAEVDEFTGAATLDDDFFSGVDAVGTKLDLARAYMDMGDPEGARSMLEEVVVEGDDSQKAEAQRLIGELG